jgi:hypothetical protein
MAPLMGLHDDACRINVWYRRGRLNRCLRSQEECAATSLGIKLLAFTAVPFGPMTTQLTIFPEDTGKLTSEARKSGVVLDGPQPALLVQGDDALGALAEVHMKLYEANVNVYASSGVADGRGSYGYVIYVKPDDYERAVAALEV